MTDLTAPVPPVPDAPPAPARAVEWRISDTPVPYPDALAEMEARVEAIRAGTAPELVWLLEHPPLYTAGTSAREEDLLEPGRFPVYQAGRGGQFTYHGPGQRVAYVMLDLKTRGADIRAFVQDLEEWLIRTLAAFNIRGERREGRVGIWVDKRPYGGAPGQEDKIAAIGVRVRRWVSFHGVALNVEPDLSHFTGIVPCGISEHGVTSIVALGHLVTMEDVDAALMASFAEVFGGAVGGGGPEEE
ncbi:lipoyl(octanoyl) transferase LipB [Azospirillum argentinense]